MGKVQWSWVKIPSRNSSFRSRHGAQPLPLQALKKGDAWGGAGGEEGAEGGPGTPPPLPPRRGAQASGRTAFDAQLDDLEARLPATSSPDETSAAAPACCGTPDPAPSSAPCDGGAPPIDTLPSEPPDPLGAAAASTPAAQDAPLPSGPSGARSGAGAANASPPASPGGGPPPSSDHCLDVTATARPFVPDIDADDEAVALQVMPFQTVSSVFSRAELRGLPFH